MKMNYKVLLMSLLLVPVLGFARGGHGGGGRHSGGSGHHSGSYGRHGGGYYGSGYGVGLGLGLGSAVVAGTVAGDGYYDDSDYSNYSDSSDGYYESDSSDFSGENAALSARVTEQQRQLEALNNKTEKVVEAPEVE